MAQYEGYGSAGSYVPSETYDYQRHEYGRSQESQPTSYRDEEAWEERKPGTALVNIVWLATGLGLLADGIAVYESPAHPGPAIGLFWVAIVSPFLIYSSVLLLARPSRRLRQLTIALVGLYPTIMYRLSSPLVLAGFDEHLHERTLTDLLAGGGLFAPNPMLQVSPYYPGLELFTGTAIRLTGMPVALGMSLVVLLCRLLFVLEIYGLAITVLRSERAASLLVVLYAVSPQFYFFNSQFSYQTIALTLGLGGIYLIRRAQFKTGAAASRLTWLGMLALIGTVVSHHLTSWLILGFLIAWAIVARPQHRRVVIKAAAVMGAAVVVWTAAIANLLAGYLGPVFAAAGDELAAALGGTAQRTVFSDSAGATTPEWQKFVLIFYALACTCLAVTCGINLILRALRDRERAFGLLGLLNLLYPLTLAAHFVSAASDIGDRASTFFFLPLGLSCCLVFMELRQRHRPLITLGERGPRAFPVVALISVIYLGGVILGAGPGWGILPGPYMVSAEARTQDPATLAAVRWAAANIPSGSRVVADITPADLLASQARLWPIIQPQNGLEPAELYFSGSWTSQDTAIVRGLDISYIYVDQRLAESLPHEGYYFYDGETPKPERLTTEELAKFSDVAGLKQVFQQGTIAIYSTAGLGVAPVRDGFTGVRSMGFGELGDFAFGILAVGIVFALRRRMTWLTSALRDAGVVGAVVGLMALTIFIAGALFELRLMPGPAFTLGASLAAITVFVVPRIRRRRPIGMRISARGVTPLVLLGVLAAAAGVTLAIRAAWIIDVQQVNDLVQAHAAAGVQG